MHDINYEESDVEDTLMDYRNSDDQLESNETDNDMDVDTQVFYMNYFFKGLLKFVLLGLDISIIFLYVDIYYFLLWTYL